MPKDSLPLPRHNKPPTRPSPWQSLIYSPFVILKILRKWNHTAFKLLQVAFFHSLSLTPLRCPWAVLCIQVHSSCGCAVFRDMGIPQLFFRGCCFVLFVFLCGFFCFYSPSDWGAVRLSLVFGNLKKKSHYKYSRSDFCMNMGFYFPGLKAHDYNCALCVLI